MANMRMIFGIVTYATKGVSFGAIEPTVPNMVIPKVNGFPTIIIWAVAAVVIVWFIWNKTKFGKNLYAVGGNPEAASVSGISVFAVTKMCIRDRVLSVLKRDDMRRDFSLTCVIIIGEEAEKVNIDLIIQKNR